jgi:abortive infection bacteriophage resistance protein
MKKLPFTKPATTHLEQIALLQERGMNIGNPDLSTTYLKHINYYRFGAYWLPFEINPTTHQFKIGTNFEEVIKLYNFDRELRLLVLDALERIEISMRAQWTYNLAHNHGSHAHLDRKLSANKKRFTQNLTLITKEVKRADEVFIKHANNKYKENLPAIWMVSEVISLGLLSKLYSNLKPMPTRKAIARAYGLDQRLIGSWLHHLTHIRNICAHHSRLWNREFVNIPMKPIKKPTELVDEFVDDSRKIYNTLVILLFFMDVIASNHRWRNKLKILLQNSDIPLAAMGFPKDWQNRSIWQ